MEIKSLAGPMGLETALLGLGLNYFLTSSYEAWGDVPTEEQERIKRVACKLAPKGGSEAKWLRAVYYTWSIKAPRFLWAEMDTYKVGTVAQSESTMRVLSMGRSFTPKDFEGEIDGFVLGKLNILLDCLRNHPKDTHFLMELKGRLPESFLQRRIWSCSLAVMQNVHRQRRNHRLELWHRVCDAFVEATPSWLREAVYSG